MTGYATVFNPTDTPQALDDAGRVLAGGEWGVAHMGAAQVVAALGAEPGRLVEVDVSSSADADVKALAAEAKERTARAASFNKAGIEDLRDLAAELAVAQAEEAGEDANLDDIRAGFDEWAKPALVHELAVNPDAVPPAPATKE